jgi:hypothetical protein
MSKTRFDFTATEVGERRQGLITKLQLAFLAIGGRDYNKSFCECDYSVGAVPCRYCAVYDALIAALHAIET